MQTMIFLPDHLKDAPAQEKTNYLIIVASSSRARKDFATADEALEKAKTLTSESCALYCFEAKTKFEAGNYDCAEFFLRTLAKQRHHDTEKFLEDLIVTLQGPIYQGTENFVNPHGKTTEELLELGIVFIRDAKALKASAQSNAPNAAP